MSRDWLAWDWARMIRRHNPHAINPDATARYAARLARNGKREAAITLVVKACGK
jgi:hypothetical protein